MTSLTGVNVIQVGLPELEQSMRKADMSLSSLVLSKYVCAALTRVILAR